MTEYGLAVAEGKTLKLMFNRFRKEDSEAFDFLGFEFRRIVDRTRIDTVMIRTAPKRLRRIVKAFKEWLRENLCRY